MTRAIVEVRAFLRAALPSPGIADDVGPGMRTTTYKKRTLVAYEVDESSGELVVNVLGVFHGWPGLGGRAQRRPGRSGVGPMTRPCVANAWQMRGRRIDGDHSWPTLFNAFPQVRATMPTTGHQRPLSAPRFPWYYWSPPCWCSVLASLSAARATAWVSRCCSRATHGLAG